MITSEVFKSEPLRKKLADALDVVNIAFMVIESEEAEKPPVKHDPLEYSMAYARREAFVLLKRRLYELAKVPREQLGPLETSYAGVDAFEQIRLDAEAEYAQAHPRQPLPPGLIPPPETPTQPPSTKKRK